MLRVMIGALMVVAAWLPGTAYCAEKIHIALGSGSEKEVAAKEQLLHLIEQYDLSHWLFTREVLIDEKQWIPHSHPVLTLNARYLDDDDSQLATFLHEQFHWYAADKQQQVDAAVQEFKQMFPTVPSGRAGARNEYSTYLHLIVCDLELASLEDLLGNARALEVISGWQHYTWIYSEVLNNPQVREVNMRHGLVIR